jgi:hypothetical protein
MSTRGQAGLGWAGLDIGRAVCTLSEWVGARAAQAAGWDVQAALDADADQARVENQARAADAQAFDAATAALDGH